MVCLLNIEPAFISSTPIRIPFLSGIPLFENVSHSNQTLIQQPYCISAMVSGSSTKDLSYPLSLLWRYGQIQQLVRPVKRALIEPGLEHQVLFSIVEPRQRK